LPGEALALHPLIRYMALRTARAGLHAILAPMLAVAVAVAFLPRGLAGGLGEEVAEAIAPGLAGLAAAMAGLPLALLSVVEARSGVYSHLLLSGATPMQVALSRLLVNAAASAALGVAGLAGLTLLHGYPEPGRAAAAAPLIALGSLGVAAMAVAAASPFRSPQAAGVAVTAAVALAEYASPIYYPAAALPEPIAALTLTVNPLAAAVEAVRSGPTPQLAAQAALSSTLWLAIAALALARVVKRSV